MIVHRQAKQPQNEPDVISMNEEFFNIAGPREYETLTTDTQKPPADDDAGSVYDIIPDEPETYEALRDGVDNTGANNIQEQQPTHSLLDDEDNAPEVPPPRPAMYLELLDDEVNIASNNIQARPADHPMYLELIHDGVGNAPDAREDIDASRV